MLSMGAMVLEFVLETQYVVRTGVRDAVPSYLPENVKLKGVMPRPKRVGCEDFQCDVPLRPGHVVRYAHWTSLMRLTPDHT